MYNCVLTPALIIHSDTSSVVSSSRGKEALLAGCLVLHSGKLYYTVEWEQPLLLIIVAGILWKYLSPEMFWSGSGSEECFADVVSGIKRRNWTRHQQASKQSLDQWCAAMSSPHCVQRGLFLIFHMFVRKNHSRWMAWRIFVTQPNRPFWFLRTSVTILHPLTIFKHPA